MFLEPTTVGTSTLLVYDDIPAAHAYLVEVFGLTPGPVETHDGETVHAEVRAVRVIWMPLPSGGYLGARRPR